MYPTLIQTNKLANSAINSYSILNAPYGVLRMCSITVTYDRDIVRYSMVVSRYEGRYLVSAYRDTERLDSSEHTSLRSVRLKLNRFIAYVVGRN